jgi:hypothetical protein
MDEGRNGDIVIIDNEISSKDPTSVGLWIKLPLTDQRSPQGTVVTGFPNIFANGDNSITINSVVVTLSNPFDIQAIVDDINIASIPGITAFAIGGAVQLVSVSGGAIDIGPNNLGLISSPALANIETAGVWCPLGITTYKIVSRNVQFFVENPEEKAYPILQSAAFYFTIEHVIAKTTSGTINYTIQINETPIPGLTEITSTITQTKTTSIDGNVVNIGDSVYVILSDNNGAADISMTIIYEYRTLTS